MSSSASLSFLCRLLAPSTVLFGRVFDSAVGRCDQPLSFSLVQQCIAVAPCLSFPSPYYAYRLYVYANTIFFFSLYMRNIFVNLSELIPDKYRSTLFVQQALMLRHRVGGQVQYMEKDSRRNDVCRDMGRRKSSTCSTLVFTTFLLTLPL